MDPPPSHIVIAMNPGPAVGTGPGSTVGGTTGQI